jgi:hypothetical protein
VRPLPDSSNKLEQVQHRLLAFTENWPGLRRWFSKFKVVSGINCNYNMETVFGVAAQIVLEVMNKASGRCMGVYMM